MKKIMIIMLIGFTSFTLSQAAEEFPNFKDAYFGQTPPGDSAVMFAPEVFSLSNRLESQITFSPDGKECYFSVIEIKDRKALYKIYYTKYVNNKWTEQLEAPFSVNNKVSSPTFSADGKRLYIGKDGDIWMLERTIEGWGEPQLLPSPINSDTREGSYSETTDGDIYVSSKRPGGFGGIDNWHIRRLTDQSLKAENLGPILNSAAFDVTPYIAPDGSYLIFGSETNGRRGEAHLYISFNKGNDEWSTPMNMNCCGAKINNETAHHNSPTISPDGKYLFFVRHENMTTMNVFWVSTNIIDEIKNEVFNLTNKVNEVNDEK